MHRCIPLLVEIDVDTPNIACVRRALENCRRLITLFLMLNLMLVPTNNEFELRMLRT